MGDAHRKYVVRGPWLGFVVRGPWLVVRGSWCGFTNLDGRPSAGAPYIGLRATRMRSGTRRASTSSMISPM